MSFLIPKLSDTYLLLNLGCTSQGYYGENCSIPCPPNCLDGRCHIVEGTCYRCVDGYSGTTCSKGQYYIYITYCCNER